MVLNLLDNALKYNPADGRINITLNPGRDKLNLTINDNGSGIPADELPYIFTRFKRGGKSRSENGSGLGWNLVQAIVISHGGTINAISKPGEGTTFLVTLPRYKIDFPDVKKSLVSDSSRDLYQTLQLKKPGQYNQPDFFNYTEKTLSQSFFGGGCMPTFLAE